MWIFDMHFVHETDSNRNAENWFDRIKSLHMLSLRAPNKVDWIVDNQHGVQMCLACLYNQNHVQFQWPLWCRCQYYGMYATFCTDIIFEKDMLNTIYGVQRSNILINLYLPRSHELNHFLLVIDHLWHHEMFSPGSATFQTKWTRILAITILAFDWIELFHRNRIGKGAQKSAKTNTFL